MFAREEEESEQTEPEIQMKSGKSLSTDIESAIQARFGNPTIQEKGMPINSDPVLENEADVMGTKAAQGKMADVSGKGNGVQRKAEEETPVEPENKHESYKSKAFKTTKDAPLSELTEKDGKISKNDIKAKEKKFKVNSKLIIPKGLKVSLLGTDFSYEKKGKSFVKKEIAQVKVVDESNSEWNKKVVWTTRSNISTTEDENGFYMIKAGDANVRESAVEVDGAQKTIPKDSELSLKDYKFINGLIYVLAFNDKTEVQYGWIEASSIDGELANETFGLEKVKYISEDANHSTINRNDTVIFKEENNYNYTEYLKEGNNYVLIPNSTKIKITNSDGNFSEVEGIDGTKYGWTSNGNYKKTEEADIFEIIDSDARLRVKQKKYSPIGKMLSVGDFIITDGLSENNKYTKIVQDENINDNNKKEDEPDKFVLTENLTNNW
jgi:hypothetical protein